MQRIMKSGIAIVMSMMLFLSGMLPWLPTAPAFANETTTKPNIIVIMGDDIGWFNISAYNLGMMGYETPNIDSIADDGILFTDFYGEQSCTAGRAAFITGQSPARTGLTKIGLPGAKEGLQLEDPTLAELLKPLGYKTAQFGKNHLGDLDMFLPTAHGFDEFFGNLYHLNAEEEPENEDYPELGKYPLFDLFRPRGVLHSYADNTKQCPAGAEDVTDEESLGQRVCDTGPLTQKRMETIDEEVLDRTLAYLDEVVQPDANGNTDPFFVWFNSTRNHIFTHLKDEVKGVTGQGVYADGLVEHDGHVGQLLNKLDELGIADNTIVIYTTDNGAEVFSWPDGATIPFRSEKNSTWEGGFRVPAMIKWPGHIPSGVVSHDIISHQDMLPTLMAAVGVDDIKEQLLTGYTAGDTTYNVHIDGYNFLPYLTSLGGPDSEVATPREEFFYLTDGGFPSALRFEDWKLVFSEMQGEGFDVWFDPYVNLRGPRIINLRRDPFEKATYESSYYDDWLIRRSFLIGPAIGYLGQFLETFKAYPPRQLPGSFGIDKMVSDLMEELEHPASNN
ncbi:MULTISPECIES: arylsulfatase [unclassified Moorena]|uniref:arylsulfatase n=1 Tax=unclassified Moorena TaxID=2683338 RepID=UPI0013BE0183|nr:MULTISPECIES: arylsulfatase [unclassified Moorena]NER85514.1 arylsulfatase [Moorena sp. SIO3A2]NES42421.1 arylsulfatase [Moorena sp. SIO2C4]